MKKVVVVCNDCSKGQEKMNKLSKVVIGKLQSAVLRSTKL